MNEDDRKVEAWLKAVAPARVSDRLRGRIMSDLDVPQTKAPVRDRRIAWGLAAAACLTLATGLWWINSPTPTPEPTPIAKVSATDHDLILDLPPTAWGYQMALSHSEGELDRLLDFHSERYHPNPRPVTMANLLE